MRDTTGVIIWPSANDIMGRRWWMFRFAPASCSKPQTWKIAGGTFTVRTGILPVGWRSQDDSWLRSSFRVHFKQKWGYFDLRPSNLCELPSFNILYQCLFTWGTPRFLSISLDSFIWRASFDELRLTSFVWRKKMNGNMPRGSQWS